jgi:hypothetical protein
MKRRDKVLVENRDSKEKVSVEFVLSVLRQHEIELNRLIATFEVLVSKVNRLSCKLEHFVDDTSHRSVIV